MAPVEFMATASVRIAEKTRKIARHLFDDYHPELHYMRGPGPKWREKHGLAPVQTEMEQPDLSSLWKASA